MPFRGGGVHTIAFGQKRTFGISLVTSISQVRILPKKGHNLKLAAPTIVIFAFFVPQFFRMLKENDREYDKT